MIARTFLQLIAGLLVAGVLASCEAPKAVSGHGTSTQSTRNNSYSLLHQLLDQQKDVSILRFIKSEPSDLKNLVKRIAANSATGAALLEEFARRDPSINPEDFRLPPGEAGTRAAIAATDEKELLGHTGKEFELALLLTQTQALSYGWHLAKVAAENEPDPDRVRALNGLSEDMQNLYHEVFALLLLETK